MANPADQPGRIPLPPQHFVPAPRPPAQLAVPPREEFVPQTPAGAPGTPGALPTSAPLPQIPAAKHIGAYGAGIFTADLDEPGQAAVRKKGIEEMLGVLVPGRYVKSIVGVGEGPPLIDNPGARKISKSSAELPHLNDLGETPGEVAARRLNEKLGARPRTVAPTAPGTEPRRYPLDGATPTPVAARPVTAGPLPGVVSGRPVRATVPAVPAALVRGAILAGAVGDNNGVAIVPFVQGGSRGTVGVLLPVDFAGFNPIDVEPLTLIAVASADAAEGIRRELITEYADP